MAAKKASSKPAKKSSGKGKRIVMVVDDNPDLVYSVKENLEAITDYDVITADGGKKCLEILEKQKPNLILLDIMMPGMDGWDLCAKIKSKKETENIPIVFLTAKTDPISKSMGRLASMDYIEKPFDPQDLKSRIERILK